MIPPIADTADTYVQRDKSARVDSVPFYAGMVKPDAVFHVRISAPILITVGRVDIRAIQGNLALADSAYRLVDIRSIVHRGQFAVHLARIRKMITITADHVGMCAGMDYIATKEYAPVIYLHVLNTSSFNIVILTIPSSGNLS
jgi:hypothetical protein